MTTLLNVHIPGAPVPQGRARTGSGHHTMPPESRAWRSLAVAIIACARLRARLATLDELVEVDVTVIVARPSSRPRLVTSEAWATKWRTPAGCRGDADNYAKAALDALVDALVIRDDHLVAVLTVRKLYAGAGEEAGLVVTVGRVE